MGDAVTGLAPLGTLFPPWSALPTPKKEGPGVLPASTVSPVPSLVEDSDGRSGKDRPG